MVGPQSPSLQNPCLHPPKNCAIRADLICCPFKFRKQFAFRKKRGDDEDGPNNPSPYTGHGSSGTLSPPYPSNTHIHPRDPSPAASSRYSPTNSIDRQFTRVSDVYSQGRRGSEAPSQDPLGLKVIHRPVGERRVDVIFVHGLGGSSRMTWSKNRNLEFFWPLKFLPLEPEISEARILTFGYNANFRSGSGQNKISILDFAKDLLYDLKYAKDESVLELEDLSMGEASIIVPACILQQN